MRTSDCLQEQLYDESGYDWLEPWRTAQDGNRNSCRWLFVAWRQQPVFLGWAQLGMVPSVNLRGTVLMRLFPNFGWVENVKTVQTFAKRLRFRQLYGQQVDFVEELNLTAFPQLTRQALFAEKLFPAILEKCMHVRLFCLSPVISFFNGLYVGRRGVICRSDVVGFMPLPQLY